MLKLTAGRLAPIAGLLLLPALADDGWVYDTSKRQVAPPAQAVSASAAVDAAAFGRDASAAEAVDAWSWASFMSNAIRLLRHPAGFSLFVR